MDITVTGGAGFIGSHLVETLSEDHDVKVIDNLSSGRRDNLSGIEIIEKDVVDVEPSELGDVVFHFAANPKVNTFPDDRERDFHDNLLGTKKLLDACVESGVSAIVFASSSVVYGEDAEIPTPESHPMDPISMYGATKAGGEHLCQVYSKTFDIDLTIVRLANIVGGRNPKGVIYDFVHKLKERPEKLEILGNGKQKKSYIHVEDTVNGIIHAWKSGGVFNIGNQDSTSVDRIADIVAEEMGLDPEYEYTGGEKGWTGDVPEMRLDIQKLEAEGWSPSASSDEAVRKTAREILDS